MQGDHLYEHTYLSDSDQACRMMETDGKRLPPLGGFLCELLHLGQSHGPLGLVDKCRQITVLRMMFGC